MHDRYTTERSKVVRTIKQIIIVCIKSKNYKIISSLYLK
jgi:hypothetical protein